MLRKLFSYTRGVRLKAVLASVTVILEVACEVFIPYLMSDIVDKGIASGDVGFIIKRGLLMIATAAVSLLMGALSARFASVSSAGFSRNLRAGLFNRVQQFSFANVDRFSTASLITRLTTDVNNVQQAFMMIIRTMVRSPMMLVMALIMAIRIGGDLAVVFAVALPVLALSLIIIVSKTYPRFRAMLKKFDAMNASVQENLTAIRVVKAFVRGDFEDKQFTAASEDVRAAQIKAEKILVVNFPIAQYIVYLCMVAVCYLGGVKIIGGTMLTGELMSFISYVGQILSSLMMMSMMMVMMVLTYASASRINEVLSEQPSINDDNADPALSVEDGSVVFEDVCFSYSNKADNLTLEHINLSIAPGETVGVIGGTGSAKTTLVQLIPRLYDVFSGCVKVGGHDVREYKIDTLRDSVSMVLQKNVLFSGTIKENLRWGDPGASDEEIESACRAAAADSFIKAFPDGYETELGQGGVNVSGGQKQRLCIARALLKRPKVIILDDSTSAVDTATDASIRRAMREELSDTTTFIIAQRITSVMDADRIIVMDDGRISDVGTHDELMQRSEIYREVYESQQKGVA